MEPSEILTLVLICFAAAVFIADLLYKVIKLVKKSSCLGSNVEMTTNNQTDPVDDIAKKLFSGLLQASGNISNPQKAAIEIISSLTATDGKEQAPDAVGQ